MNRSTAYWNGHSLVEVTLALGIASVCFTIVLGLLPVGLQTSQHVIQQNVAAHTLAAVAVDLRTTPKTVPPGGPTTSRQFEITIPGRAGSITTFTLFFSSDGQFSTSPIAQSRCRLTIVLRPNLDSSGTTLAHLRMTWPAEAEPVHAAGLAEMLVGLDRN